MVDENGYLTIEQAATLLQVHYNTVYRWLVAGTLPGAKFGDSWRIRKEDIDAFFKKKGEGKLDVN